MENGESATNGDSEPSVLTCSACGEQHPRSAFTEGQLREADASRKCAFCLRAQRLANAPPDEPVAASVPV